MCGTCGCGEPGDEVKILKPGEEHDHDHGHHHHDHPHSHDHGHHHHHDHEGKVIEVQKDIMAKNEKMAERNRGYFEAKNIFALNLVSSPGSGKTTLLEKTITALKDADISVIEGDQQTLNDANRIDATGAPVVQVNTGNGCHLDADMIHKAIHELDLKDNAYMIIENVGNLVCPALFDLGEHHKVVIMSTTEGEDKPLKYPTMFSVSDICIINKTGLLPYLDFDVEKFKEYALQVNHHLKFFEVSAKTGEGMREWLDWLKNKGK